MTWTQGRRLATMSGNGQSLSFTYNADGIRTSKTVNGVTHFYHLAGTRILSEEWMDANNVQHLIVYHYDANGQPVGMSYRNSTQGANEYESFLFVKNLQGDIIKVLDNHGDLLVSYTYDAWGVCFTTNHNVSGTNRYATYNPFRYRGYFYDSETGFYYLNSRYYNPEIGRFINADKLVSTGQGILGYNMFAYCGNNPIIYFDPSGDRYSNAEIHNFVVKDICITHNQGKMPELFCTLTYMKYFTPYKTHWYGFCDIFNVNTGEIWEVKRYRGGSTCKMENAFSQLNNYVRNGWLVHFPNSNLKIGGE